MESYNVVKEMGNLPDVEKNSIKFLSLYILISGIALGLFMMHLLGSIVGFGIGLNALVFSGSSWIIGSVMIVEEE